MGGEYGVFIWSSYGATALVVAVLIGRAIWRHRDHARRLARLEAAETRPDGEARRAG